MHGSAPTTSPESSDVARKREHLESYVAREDGSYEYQGKLFRWTSAQERAGFLRKAFLLLGLAGALLIAAGCVPAPGGYAFYAIIPYAGAVVACVLVGSCLLRLSGAGANMADPLDVSEHVRERSLELLPVRVVVAMAACVASAVGEAVNIVLTLVPGYAEAIPVRALFAVLLACAAVALWALKAHVGTAALHEVGN